MNDNSIQQSKKWNTSDSRQCGVVFDLWWLAQRSSHPVLSSWGSVINLLEHLLRLSDLLIGWCPAEAVWSTSCSTSSPVNTTVNRIYSSFTTFTYTQWTMLTLTTKSIPTKQAHFWPLVSATQITWHTALGNVRHISTQQLLLCWIYLEMQCIKTYLGFENYMIEIDFTLRCHFDCTLSWI